MTDATLRLTQPDHIGAADIDRINRLPVAERVAAIRAHQSEHWRTGRSIAAEVYFDAFEFLSDDASDALVIIGGEMGYAPKPVKDSTRPNMSGDSPSSPPSSQSFTISSASCATRRMVPRPPDRMSRF